MEQRAKHRATTARRRPLSVIEQIGLYQLFHRDPSNKLMHVLTMPLILCSGQAMLALLPPLYVPHPLLPLNAAFALTALSIGSLLPLEPLAVLAFSAWIVPGLLLANFVAAHCAAWLVLAGGSALQALAWYGAVVVGHERLEGSLTVKESPTAPSARVDSNVYFARGYFVLRRAGVRATFLESLQQFTIAPLASTLDLMAIVGYKPELMHAIAQQSSTVEARLAIGLEPFAATAEATDAEAATGAAPAFVLDRSLALKNA